MLSHRTIVVLPAILLCAGSVFGGVVFYEIPDYRSAADSPFSHLDEFYLEDFEDGLLNTPNVTSPDGFVWTMGDVRSVDGDDGVIDGVSNGIGTLISTRPVAPLHFFEFSPDSQGRYPNYVGVVVTHEPDLRRPVDSFSALSGTGGNLPTGSEGFFVEDLIAVTDDVGNVEHSRFIGIFWDEGISSFGVSRALQLDHLQYSYAIPEPSCIALLGISALGAILRRRR